MLLGKYEIQEVLGRGGFGTVYKGYDKVLDRTVAVKVLHPNLVNDPTFLARFQREAQIAAKLDHPNLVPVYDFGESEGHYYIVMGYMPGGSLKDRLSSEGPIEKNLALNYISQIGEGLDFAHSRNVIHRDLKPGNILFDERGKVRVSDMGFAKLLHSDASMSMTVSGGIVGTPAYMAPEIWNGKPATAATDVYSVACILAEMITGSPLFEGETTPMVMMEHFKPLNLPDALPKEWKPVFEAALEKQQEDRIQTVGDFFGQIKAIEEFAKGSEDLESGTTLTTNRDENQALKSSEYKQFSPGNMEGEEAESHSQNSERINSASAGKEEKTVSGEAGSGKAGLIVGLVLMAIILSLVFYQIGKSNSKTKQVQVVVTATAANTATNPATNTVTNPATNTTTKVAITEDNLEQISLLQTIGHGNIVAHSLSKDQELLAVGTGYGIYILEPDTLEVIRHFAEDYSFYNLTFFPDGHKIAAHTGWYLFILDADNGEIINVFSIDEFSLGRIAMSDDGKRISLGIHYDNEIYSVNSSDGKFDQSLDSHFNWTGADHERFEYYFYNDILVCTDKISGQEVARKEGHFNYFHDLGFSADNKSILSLNDDGILRIFDSYTGELVEQFDIDTTHLSAPDRNGNSLAQSRNYLYLIDTINSEIVDEIYLPHEIMSSALTPEGHTYAFGNYEGQTFLRDFYDDSFEIELGNLRNEVNDLEETSYIPDIAFSPDGKLIAFGTFIENTSVWDVKTETLLYEFNNAIMTYRLTFSPDNKLLAAAGSELAVWDMDNGNLLYSIDDYGEFRDVAFSKDGNLLAVAGTWGEVYILDSQTSDILQILDPGRREFIYGMDFSPDGSLISVATGDGLIRIWGIDSN